MLVWIQRHDYTYEELQVDTAAEAVEAFESFDWAEEIVQVKESDDESCPPGFGMVTAEGCILHIVPGEEGDCLVHFHYPEKKRFLLLFSGTVRSTLTRIDVSWEESVQLIENMFEGNLDPESFLESADGK